MSDGVSKNGRIGAAREYEALAILRAIEAELDDQIYPQQLEADFDAPDDAISAGLWRRIGRALTASVSERATKGSADHA